MWATLFLSLTTLLFAPIDVQVALKDGTTVTGKVDVRNFTIATAYGSAQVKAEHLAQIVFGDPDVIVTDGGVELRGKLKLTTLRVKTSSGNKTLRRAKLASLSVLRDGRPIGAANFSGDWIGSFGPMDLEQTGLTVKGTYGHEHDGTLEGKINGRSLEFEYRDSGGRGTGTFELWDDGTVFAGEFTARGQKEGRFWGAYRQAARQAEPKPEAITSGQTETGLIYHLRVPAGWDGKKEFPAIAFLHGSNMTSRDYVNTIASAWPEIADDYVLVGFDGEKLSSGAEPGAMRHNFTYVNFGSRTRGPLWARRQSPALVGEALKELKGQLPIRHWFVGGHSQGGFLTYAIVMFYPELVAGALPMSCNLLVQCEPDNFKDNKVRAQQRAIPIAVIHGKGDRAVEFSSGEYCHKRMVDGGFPAVRFFADDNAGHMFARLPVADAVRWLEALTSDDPAALAAWAGLRIEENRYRDAMAAVLRARELDGDGRMKQQLDELCALVDAAAKDDAERLQGAITANAGGEWVDDFLAFRREFAFAPAASPCMAAYADLRDEHAEPADALFYEARQQSSKGARNEKYREILEKYYASKWYELVKGWLE